VAYTPFHIEWMSLTFDDLKGRYALLRLNSARLGLSCYWSLRGSRILAFIWH